MWSVPPAEPPPQDTAAGFSRSARTRLCMSRCGEAAGTATTSYSPVSLAIGVDLGDRHRRLVPEDGAEHHEAVDEQRSAIAAPAVDELRQADGARRPGDVLDLDRRDQLLPFELALHLAGELVPAASRAPPARRSSVWVNAGCSGAGRFLCAAARPRTLTDEMKTATVTAVRQRIRPRCGCRRRGMRSAPSARPSTLRRFGPCLLRGGAIRDLKAAPRTLGALAAFVNGGADEFLDETLHGPTHRRVFPGQRRQRAPLTADDVAAVLLDVRHCAELVVQQLARGT